MDGVVTPLIPDVQSTDLFPENLNNPQYKWVLPGRGIWLTILHSGPPLIGSNLNTASCGLLLLLRYFVSTPTYKHLLLVVPLYLWLQAEKNPNKIT